MLLISQILRQLQVRDRVGRDQVFEAKDILQDVLAHDQVGARPTSGPPMFSKILLKHLQQERTGAAGEIEHGHALVVGEAVLDAEARL